MAPAALRRTLDPDRRSIGKSKGVDRMNQYRTELLVKQRIAELHHEADRERLVRVPRKRRGLPPILGPIGRLVARLAPAS